MIERLPTPWGLVRSGVAPDHPKIKSVTRVYEKTAAHPRFRYFGNVTFGEHVSREELLATTTRSSTPPARPRTGRSGSPAKTCPARMRPPSSSAGTTATPTTPTSRSTCSSAERAVVIGNGNVAIDVARMLVLAPSELAPTDTADHALDVLAASRVKEVVVVGRRGPAQSAFTNPELLELGELADADVIVDAAELERGLAVEDPNAEHDGPAQRRDPPLLRRTRAGRTAQADRPALPALPDRAAGRRERPSRLGRARPQRARRRRGRAACGQEPPTSTRRSRPACCSARSATAGVPLAGSALRRARRRDPERRRAGDRPGAGEQLPGEYVVGWIKRGPSGVIGTNKKDAQETVDAILADLASRATGAVPAGLPTPPEARPPRHRAAAARAPARAGHLRGMGGDRPSRALSRGSPPDVRGSS